MTIKRTGKLIEMIASWGSYYKIYADEYMCVMCDAVVALPGNEPVSMEFRENYATIEVDQKAHFIG